MSESGKEENAIIEEQAIMRTEKGQQNIRIDSLMPVLDTLGLPTDAYFCSIMEKQTAKNMRDFERLSFYANRAREDNAFLKKGVALLEKMKADKNLSQGISRQRLISHEVVIMEALGKDPQEIRELIYEGLELTYPEYDDKVFDGQMVIFEEGPLLHQMARTYMQEGNIEFAKRLLRNILIGLTRMPIDDKERERMTSPVFLTLAQVYVQEQDYAEALTVCEQGLKLAIKRNNGYYAPDFVEQLIYAHHAQGKKESLPLLLLISLAGYILLRRYTKADKILGFVKEHNISLNTYGMEKIRPSMPEIDFAIGEFANSDSIGHFIGMLRYDAKLSIDELCKGLCVKSTLTKLEGKKYPLDKVFLLEGIMQRLGRNIDYYFDTFPTHEDFANKQKRDKINNMLVHREYDEAEVLLDELAMNKRFNKFSINKQFIALSRASIFVSKNGYGIEHIAMLNEALKITRKNFNLKHVAQMHLSYYEVLIFNQMASSLCSSGEIRAGLRLFEDLIESMDQFYVDEREKKRMYTTVLYNLAGFLYHEKRHRESMEHTSTGIEIDVIYGQLDLLSDKYDNLARVMLGMGDNENCLPNFALAYYSALLVGRQDDADYTNKHVAKYLEIDFTHNKS